MAKNYIISTGLFFFFLVFCFKCICSVSSLMGINQSLTHMWVLKKEIIYQHNPEKNKNN